jgi:hypothetical protein
MKFSLDKLPKHFDVGGEEAGDYHSRAGNKVVSNSIKHHRHP